MPHPQRLGPLLLRGALAAAIVILSGCAARHAGGVGPDATSASARAADTSPGHVPARFVPARTDAKALEEIDADLAGALRTVAAAPSALHHRAVAAAYVRLKVPDTALDHFDSALGLDSTDAVSYEGRARIWRDWGMAELALGDAHRAVFYRPRSGSAHNTLGTILQMTGRLADARMAYERALAIDPSAAYALSNLCYVAFMEGFASRAEALCHQALMLEPDLTEARRNLALVAARSAEIDAVRSVLGSAQGDANTEYWLGVVLFSNRRFIESAEAFERAAAIDPSMRRALDTARYARKMADGMTNPGDHP